MSTYHEYQLRADQQGRWVCFWISFVFFAVYSLIHIGIYYLETRVTGVHPLGLFPEPTPKSFVEDIAGPITIGLCTSLLIFSFGIFLINGARLIVAYGPSVFFRAFLVFVAGLLVVQIAGHSEILYHSLKPENQAHQGIPAEVSDWFKYIAAFALPVAFGTLFFLEYYQLFIYRQIEAKVYDGQKLNSRDVYIAGLIAIASVLVALVKLAGVAETWFLLLLEGILTFFTVRNSLSSKDNHLGSADAR